MIVGRVLLLAIVLLLSIASTKAQVAATSPPAPAAADKVSTEQRASPEAITAYTLPPDRAGKAHNLHRIYFWFSLISFSYVLVVLWLILRGRFAAGYRTYAELISSRRIVQLLIFAPLFILTLDLLQLPLGIYRHWLGTSYGLTISSWPTWFWDWTKAELVTIIGGTIFIWILYVIIRHSPRRWWIWFWAASLPLGALVVFLTPLVLDPLFHKFEPLGQKDPVLTAELQKLARRAGEDIPPERMFWMGAGEKTTTLNAYVTGLGPSKRIVVWDTTIAKMSTAQIFFVSGHEMGHYVLRHIPKGLAIGAVLLLFAYYLAARMVGLFLSRWGSRWSIRGLDDLASLPVLVLLFTILAFVGNPVASAISRHYEHQADQYALEVTHGLTPNPAQACAQAFQVLGDIDLSDPNPMPADVFLFYDHPPIRDRVQSCLTYDPWSQGRQGEFVK
ncbi:MAG: peptidase Ste24p [Acidobacteria bacterium]|nr:peptidase Ste24p [Acidobacteriota bacterium]